MKCVLLPLAITGAEDDLLYIITSSHPRLLPKRQIERDDTWLVTPFCLRKTFVI